MYDLPLSNRKHNPRDKRDSISQAVKRKNVFVDVIYNVAK